MLEGPTCPHDPSRPLVLLLLTFIAGGSIPETGQIRLQGHIYIHPACAADWAFHSALHWQSPHLCGEMTWPHSPRGTVEEVLCVCVCVCVSQCLSERDIAASRT